VVLTGIRAAGRHGVDPGERLEPQEFVVDLDVTLAVSGDDLDRTVDYRDLSRLAADTVASTSFHLLESLADAVARAVYELSAVLEVTATVHKPEAAGALGVDDVSAEATFT